MPGDDITRVLETWSEIPLCSGSRAETAPRFIVHLSLLGSVGRTV